MADGNGEVLVRAKDVVKTYVTGKIESPALRGVTLDVRSGDFMSIVGPSGSGKTTLLNLIGALDSLTSGELTLLARGRSSTNWASPSSPTAAPTRSRAASSSAWRSPGRSRRGRSSSSRTNRRRTSTARTPRS